MLIAWILLKCKRRNLHEFWTAPRRLYSIPYPTREEKLIKQISPSSECFVGEILSPIRVSKFGKTVCVHLASKISLFPPPFWALENLTGAGAYCSFIYLNGRGRGRRFFSFFSFRFLSEAMCRCCFSPALCYARASFKHNRSGYLNLTFKREILTFWRKNWRKEQKLPSTRRFFSPDQSAIMTVSEKGRE